MTASAPLHGTELVDCAQANANQGIEVAANLCGIKVSEGVTPSTALQNGT